jgi:anthranilate synthase component 2
VLRAGKTTPILGVCLGHQAICEAFGMRIVHARRLMHGKQSEVKTDASCPLFAGLTRSIRAGRYHSLAAEPQDLPACLR